MFENGLDLALTGGGEGGPGCDAGSRLPTNRFPQYSKTLKATLVAGETTAQLTFEAERDTLLTDLSIEIFSSVSPLGPSVDGKVSVEYCNVTYADGTDIKELKPCCQRKPLFIVGVRENKKLRFDVELYTAVVAETTATVIVTVSGVQGQGCCG